MSDFLTNLKYRLEPIQDKLGLADKPVGRIALYTVVIVVGFGVLLWAIIPSSQPMASNPRIPETATASADADPSAPAPPRSGGGSRAAPTVPGG